MKKFIENPKRKNPPVVKPIQRPVDLTPRHSFYHALWAECHTKQDATPDWFADWLNRVPSIGCSCQRDFINYVEANPPDFNDFYKWSVDAHNFVNEKLGKPELTLDEAKAIWQ